jgi:hypothetical protein
MLWNLKTNDFSVIFDDYEQSQPIQSLFTVFNGRENYWALDGDHIVTTSIYHSKCVLLIINVKTKQLKRIDQDLEDVTILNFKHNLLVTSCSSPNQPPVVRIALVDFQKANPIEFRQLRTKYPTKNDKITYRIIAQNEDKPLEQVESIVIGQTETFNKPTPCIFIPHGGKISF